MSTAGGGRSALRETLLVAGDGVRRSLRSKRALLLLGTYGLVSLVGLAVVTWITRQISVAVGEGPEGAELDTAGAYRQFLEAIAGDPEQAAYLVAIPPLVLLFFGLNHAFLPWLAILTGFPQPAGDVESGAVRFLLLRARRGSILLGRLLANAVLLSVLTGVIAVAVLGYGVLFVEGFPLWAAAGHLLRLSVLVLLSATVWLALAGCLSSLVGPYPALLGGVVVLLGSVALGWASRIFEWAEPVRWLLPNRYREHLVSHRVGEQLLGAGALTAFVLFFVGLAWLGFRRRDL